MEELSRLVKLINRHGQKSGSLINWQDDNTLDTRLFKILEEEDVTSDQDIAKALYGSVELTTGFRMLKSRFRKKLANHLHLLKLSEEYFDKPTVATQECLALLHDGYTLYQLSEHRLAEKKYDKALELAVEYDLVDLAIKALELKQSINANAGQLRKYQEVDAVLSQKRKLREYEQEALRTYHLCMAQQKTSVKTRSELLRQYPEILSRMRKLWQLSGSSCIHSYYHILRINYNEFVGDYDAVVAAVTEAKELVKNGKVNEAWFNHRFNLHIQVYALLRSQQYQEGLSLAAEGLSFFNKYSANWFSLMENYLLLALHAKQYKLVVELMELVSEGGQLSKAPDYIVERLELIRLYAVFLQKMGRIEGKLKKVNSLKEQLPILTKDKVGFNVALLELEVLEALVEDKQQTLDQLAERVRKYSGKYLKGEESERPRLFMRMLQLALQETNVSVVRERGDKLYQKLRETPLPGDAFAEMEIVPYEHLWELVLQLLERQRKV